MPDTDVVIRPRSIPPIVPVMILPGCAGLPDTVTVPRNSAGGWDVPVVGTVVGEVVGWVVGPVVGMVVGEVVGEVVGPVVGPVVGVVVGWVVGPVVGMVVGGVVGVGGGDSSAVM